ncbi:GNAT family N-acetyltransferase [Vogesella indigofera]|uniref:GNAT family N-acetyltransferase n=1 Tax=Vogesella indigofera TaxID=45465 RepID=UPI00234FAB70|nr:GNAT family N-acetyltransferase [Vogesella indigofera]MDC7697219.1 GNAT family N-acetyltransferase [Vogesella indigofera]
MSALQLRAANLADAGDCLLLARLTDAYARDAMGGGEGLSPARQQQLAQALGGHPGLFALIAEQDGEAVGHALCVLGFSSFYAAPVCNLHDLSVLSAARGQGLGRRLLQAVASAAAQRGCAKLTLEVRDDNAVGRTLYHSEGFAEAGLGGTHYRLLEKVLTPA